MTSVLLSEKAEMYLRKLCLEIPSRRVGSEGNRAATDFFAGVVASFGFETVGKDTTWLTNMTKRKHINSGTICPASMGLATPGNSYWPAYSRRRG